MLHVSVGGGLTTTTTGDLKGFTKSMFTDWLDEE
jgi:hypothetical protein